MFLDHMYGITGLLCLKRNSFQVPDIPVCVVTFANYFCTKYMPQHIVRICNHIVCKSVPTATNVIINVRR